MRKQYVIGQAACERELKNLFSVDVVGGVELNGGDDDDFGDEILLIQ